MTTTLPVSAEDDDLDPAAVRAAIRARANAIASRELEAAIDRLEANGDLSCAQRAAVEAMTDRITGRLIATPARVLAETRDEAVLATTVRLFDPDR